MCSLLKSVFIRLRKRIMAKSDKSLVVKLFKSIITNSSLKSGILVYLYGEEEEKLHLDNYEKVYTAEEICYIVAKAQLISTVDFPLFALYAKEENIWLNPREEVKCLRDSIQHFYFRIRFIPSKDGLSTMKSQETHKKALSYLFFQMRDDFLKDKILYHKDIIEEDAHSKSLGLAVIDKLRYGKEKNLSCEDLVKIPSTQFIPERARRDFSNFLTKKKLESNFKPHLEVEYNKYKSSSVNPVKFVYIEALMSYSENYGSEKFLFMVGTDEERQVVVNPYDSSYPGLKITSTKINDSSFYHSRIEDLMDISITEVSDELPKIIHINRKQGQPLVVRFKDTRQALSFVSLLDGYFRLMGDYDHSLCTAVEMNFVKLFKSMKCHGPVSKKWAKQRLLEKNRQDSKRNFLLKLSQEKLGNFVLVRLGTSSGQELFQQIVQTAEGRFFLANDRKEVAGEEDGENGDDLEFANIQDLFKHYKQPPPMGMGLENIVIPTAPYDPLIYLCGSSSSASPAEIPKYFEEQKSSGISIVSSVELKEKIGSGEFTEVYRSNYTVGNANKEVAVKRLKTQHVHHFKYFTNMVHKTAFWSSCNTVVSVLAVCLEFPISVIMEYAPLGHLKDFLATNEKYLSRYLIHSAAEQIAQALYHLQVVMGQVHGNIRCKNILVFKYSEKKLLLVKLSDPGIYPFLLMESDNPVPKENLPWMAPECRKHPYKLTLESDRYAYGTMLWEMYSFGKNPPDSEIINLQRNCAHLLPQPGTCPEEIYKIMTQCWSYIPDHRIGIKDVVRDIRQFANKGGGIYNEYNDPIDDYGKATLRKDASDQSPHQEVRVMNGGGVINMTGFTQFDSCNSETPLICQNSTPSSLAQSASGDSNLSNITNRTTVDLNSGGSNSDSFRQSYVSSSNQDIMKHNLNVDLSATPLGQGHYGKVYKGTCKGDDGKVMTVAVKCLKKNMCNKYWNEFEKEYQIMKTLKHDNIVCVIGRCLEFGQESPQVLVLEYVELGCLRDYLCNNKESLGLQMLLNFGLEIALGMEYLASLKIVHRDLAARNVLVTGEQHMKIGDFGLSRALSPDRDYYKSDGNKELPAPWCAPESLSHQQFTEKTDVWSYGVTLWEVMSYGDSPHLCDIKDLFHSLHKGNRLAKPKNCPLYVHTFIIHNCWDFYASKRRTFQEIVQKYHQNLLNQLK